MAFVAFLYQEKLSASTVKNYLAAVRFAQIALGLGDPCMGEMPHLEYVVKVSSDQQRSARGDGGSQ